MIKKIWITGASSGIGKALAIKFANEGWQVAASARREKLLKDLNEQNSNIHSFPLDVKNEAETKNTFQNIIEKFDNGEEYANECKIQFRKNFNFILNRPKLPEYP